jgi:integrase
MNQQQGKWKLFKDSWVSTKPVLPRVWQRKEGGHVVRARVIERTTGKQREIWKVLPDADQAAALKWIDEEMRRVREGIVSLATPKTRFSEFAASLFETKVKVGEIRSAKGRQKWSDVLQHLVGGTVGKQSKIAVAGLGDFYLDMLSVAHVAAWRSSIADLVNAGDYAPTTVNGWIAILKVILKAAKRELGLPSNAAEDLAFFDLAEHETYTDEEPNALLPEEVGPFLAHAKSHYSAHFAMIFVGLCTGLRPSSLRPLRRRGGEADVLWDKNRILVRRSHTVGEEVMRTTKQRRRYPIDLPEDVMSVLRWHVETQLATSEQQESDLLFPSTVGGFRTPCVLNKPLGEIASALGLEKRFTQRGLRRTYNDLTRAAGVADLVVRSISGHQTERMQHHYSSVNAAEQRDAIAKVLRLFDGSNATNGRSERSGEESGEGAPTSGEEKRKAG